MDELLAAREEIARLRAALEEIEGHRLTLDDLEDAKALRGACITLVRVARLALRPGGAPREGA